MKMLTIWTLSAGVGAVGVRSSSGAHRLHPALQLQAQRAAGKLSLQGELLASTWTEPRLNLSARDSYLRPSLLVGGSVGTGAASVGLYGGPSLVWMLGEEGSVLRPGLRLRGDLSRTLAERWLIRGSMGWCQRGQSGDVDLALSAGISW